MVFRGYSCFLHSRITFRDQIRVSYFQANTAISLCIQLSTLQLPGWVILLVSKCKSVTAELTRHLSPISALWAVSLAGKGAVGGAEGGKRGKLNFGWSSQPFIHCYPTPRPIVPSTDTSCWHDPER